MPPNKIFASGVGLIEHPWFNQATLRSEGGSLEDDGKSTKVRWIAIRGGYHDWAIYHSMDANFCPHSAFNCDAEECHLLKDELRISQWGAKIHNPDKVQELVPCDDEALEMYRH